MFSRLLIVICVVALLVSVPYVNSYATEISIDIPHLTNSQSVCDKTINSRNLCIWKNQTDNMPADVINFFNNEYIQKINRISTYTLFFETLTLQEYVAKGVELYRDENGNEWYVRYCMQTNFKEIASVVASQIHNMLADDETSNANVKFVVALDKDTPKKFKLIGAATQRRNFTSVWDLDTSSIAKPSNLEKEYAIWHFLGMPPAHPNCIGFFDDAKEKVARLDYDTAFSHTSLDKDKMELNCFKTDWWTLKQYECDLEKIRIELSRYADSPHIFEIIKQAQENLALLRIDNINEPFEKIKLFLNK